MTYTYDVQDNRIQEERWKSGEGNSTKRFVFDYAGGNVIIDTDGSNNAQTRRIYGDATDQVLVRSEASGTTAGVSVYFTDRLGSVRDVANASGVVKGHVEFDGFGNRTEVGLAWLDRYGFTAREWQFDVGMSYHRARWYDPARGEWINEDPIDFAAGDENLMRYVGNNGTNATDPSGLVVFIVHGVLSSGKPWFEEFETEMNKRWEKQGAAPQKFIPHNYGDRLHNFLIDTAGVNLERKTGVSSATTLLRKPTRAVERAAADLAKKIKAFRDDPKNKDEPINLFGHSNGTMVILLALLQLDGKKYKVDNVVLAASPLKVSDIEDRKNPMDGSEYRSNMTLLKEAAKRATTIYRYYSRWDGVTRIVGGAAPLPVKIDNVVDINQSNIVVGDTVVRYRSMPVGFANIKAHLDFADTKKWPFPAYTGDLAWYPMKEKK